MDRTDANNEKQVFNIKNAEFFILCVFRPKLRSIDSGKFSGLSFFGLPPVHRLAMHRFVVVGFVHTESLRPSM